MAGAAIEEEFLSGPNVLWFATGIAAEFFFLAWGITPGGMEAAGNLAEVFGMVAPAGGAEILSYGGEAALDWN
ncbi:MAG: hypothetical protein KAJ86_08030 [Alphaproteobacteria bacterium]|nr:hypothetical protein [Alphaproteobacteria bacterium]